MSDFKIGDKVQASYDRRYKGVVEKIRKDGILVRFYSLKNGKLNKKATILRVEMLEFVVSDKPKEFWLELGNECDDIVWRTPISKETIHVIEYEAYEKLLKLNEALIEGLEGHFGEAFWESPLGKKVIASREGSDT